MKQKILIIEDDRVLRENTAELLELTGYSVKTVEGGKEGIYEAKNFLPDLILCDIMMPGMDGYEVLQKLHESDEEGHISFVFITALSDRQFFRQGMELGAHDYLTKPFTR